MYNQQKHICNSYNIILFNYKECNNMRNNLFYSKRKPALSIILTGAILLSLSGCGSKPAASFTNNSHNLSTKEVAMFENTLEPNDSFKTAYSDFSINMLKANGASVISQGKNFLISPESISIAMTMAGTGANGDTKKEIYDVLGNGLAYDEYESMLSYMEAHLKSENLIFNSANSIWIRDDANRIKVNEDFLNKNKSYFNAESYMAPFNNTTLKEVNGWVDTKTNHMIPSILDSIDDSSVMYIINAIAFEAEWNEEYEESQIKDKTFINGTGESEDAKMLHSLEGIYLSSTDATGVVKPYKGSEYAFMAILPNENISITDYVNGLDGKTLSDMYANRTYEDVITEIPKFSYDYDTNLNDTLIDLGIRKAFSENADFTNMAETATSKLYIDKVLHKTHIELDEKGTKAAAVTAVVMSDSATCSPDDITQPKEVILDRPFLYGIIDTNSGLPLFLGVVNTIK